MAQVSMDRPELSAKELLSVMTKEQFYRYERNELSDQLSDRDDGKNWEKDYEAELVTHFNSCIKELSQQVLECRSAIAIMQQHSLAEGERLRLARQGFRILGKQEIVDRVEPLIQFAEQFPLGVRRVERSYQDGRQTKMQRAKHYVETIERINEYQATRKEALQIPKLGELFPPLLPLEGKMGVIICDADAVPLQSVASALEVTQLIFKRTFDSMKGKTGTESIRLALQLLQLRVKVYQLEMTQKTLSNLINETHKTLSEYEAGLTKEPKEDASLAQSSTSPQLPLQSS